MASPDRSTKLNPETLHSPKRPDGHVNDFYVDSESAVVITAMNVGEDDCFEICRVSLCNTYEESIGCAHICECHLTLTLSTAGRYRLKKTSAAPSEALITACPTAIIPGMSCATQETSDMSCKTADPQQIAGAIGEDVVKTALAGCLADLIMNNDVVDAAICKKFEDLLGANTTIKTQIAQCICDSIESDTATQTKLNNHLKTADASECVVAGIEANDNACEDLLDLLISDHPDNSIRALKTPGIKGFFENDSVTGLI